MISRLLSFYIGGMYVLQNHGNFALLTRPAKRPVSDNTRGPQSVLISCGKQGLLHFLMNKGENVLQGILEVTSYIPFALIKCAIISLYYYAPCPAKDRAPPEAVNGQGWAGWLYVTYTLPIYSPESFLS